MAILRSLGYRALTSAYPAARIWNRDWERTGQFRASLETTVHIPLLPRKARINPGWSEKRDRQGLPQFLGYNWDQNMALLLFQLALGSSSIPWCTLSAPISYFLMREMNSPKRLQSLSGIWAPENRQNSGRTLTGLQTLYLSYFYWYPLVLIIT